MPCARCGHLVEESDRLYTIVLRGLPYGFHAPCYAEWSDAVSVGADPLSRDRSRRLG